jgi:hypothetical protein
VSEVDGVLEAFREGLLGDVVWGGAGGDEPPVPPVAYPAEEEGPAVPDVEGRAQYRGTCRGCGEENPTHSGANCPVRLARRGKAEGASTASSSGGPETVDFRGNRVQAQGSKNLYILLRTPKEGPEPGLYSVAWNELESICFPECKLPQTGYGYRKVADTGTGRHELHKQGHRRTMPEFFL